MLCAPPTKTSTVPRPAARSFTIRSMNSPWFGGSATYSISTPNRSLNLAGSATRRSAPAARRRPGAPPGGPRRSAPPTGAPSPAGQQPRRARPSGAPPRRYWQRGCGWRGRGGRGLLARGEQRRAARRRQPTQHRAAAQGAGQRRCGRGVPQARRGEPVGPPGGGASSKGDSGPVSLILDSLAHAGPQGAIF